MPATTQATTATVNQNTGVLLVEVPDSVVHATTRRNAG
jgi:hypothetical protein